MALPRREKEEAEEPSWFPANRYVTAHVDGDCDLCGQQVYVGDSIVARGVGRGVLIHEACDREQE